MSYQIPSDETDVCCYLIVSGIPKKPPESPNPQSEKNIAKSQTPSY